ncbi:hypothetical protein M422DRAFT_150404, partial [Sphaerobolus stellatus SS14]
IFFYVEEEGTKDPYPIQSFQQRFLSGKPQMDPVLDVLAEVLHLFWDYYDPLCCNGLIASALIFMTGSCIEISLDTMTIPLVPNVTRFAWFMRDGTGIARSFATFGFTKSRGMQAMDFIQAVPDMEYWMNVGNDLISFYKEELQGETNNYIHIRARNENKSPVQVLSEIVQELVTSRDTIYAALAHNPTALSIWKGFEQGFLHWHLIQDRYKLRDLSLS